MKNILAVLNKIKNTASIKDKIDIISKNKDNKLFHDIVILALNYDIVFNVNDLAYIPNNNTSVSDLISYLYEIGTSNKRGMTNNERNYLSKLASISKETFEITNRIISKDLKCGASLKLFNKVFDDIKIFELMTCISDINKFSRTYKRLEEKSYFWSIKKDGVRCLCVEDDNIFRYISRSGKEYKNFIIFNDDLYLLFNYIEEKYKISNFGIDGEVISYDSSYLETMRHIRKDNDNTKFQFHIFDITNTNLKFYERQNILNDVFNKYKFNYLCLLKHNEIISDNIDIKALTQIMNNVHLNGDEGIVVKMGSSPYQFKEKSKYWCKMKPFETLDLLVVDKFYGKPGSKYEKLIGGFIVKYKNKKVRVGSGLSDDDRKLFLNYTPRIIEVSCKGETESGSLREPRFIRVRDDKLTVSDE